MSNSVSSSVARIAIDLGELDVETFEVKDCVDYSDMVFGSTCSSSSSSSCSSTCTSTSTSSCATA